MRRNLVQRNQHKCPLLKPLMGNHQARQANHKIVIEQNVQVQCPRAIGNGRQPVAAELPLDLQQRTQQLEWRQLRFERHHRVQKPRLLGIPHRRRRVKRRARSDRIQLLKASKGRRQRGFRWADLAGKVRAQANACGPHPLQGTRTSTSSPVDQSPFPEPASARAGSPYPNLNLLASLLEIVQNGCT